jgi:hypothetical protein
MVDKIKRLPNDSAAEIAKGGLLSVGGVQAAAEGLSEGM